MILSMICELINANIIDEWLGIIKNIESITSENELYENIINFKLYSTEENNIERKNDLNTKKIIEYMIIIRKEFLSILAYNKHHLWKTLDISLLEELELRYDWRFIWRMWNNFEKLNMILRKTQEWSYEFVHRSLETYFLEMYKSKNQMIK